MPLRTASVTASAKNTFRSKLVDIPSESAAQEAADAALCAGIHVLSLGWLPEYILRVEEEADSYKKDEDQMFGGGLAQRLGDH